MRLGRGSRRRSRLRVGWIGAATLVGETTSFRKVPPPMSMRINHNALWMNRHCDDVHNEIYRPGRDYDVVVFVRAMDERAQEEREQLQVRGTRVLFEVHVNYWEIWGDYWVEETRPTPEQQRDAIAMTAAADGVITSSSYLREIALKHNDDVTWIPDSVDLRRYRPRGRHVERRPLRLVWSGIAKKAQHLLEVAEPLRGLRDVELVLVSDGEPNVLRELEAVVPCRVERWTDRRYARILRGCDAIISPKRLVNGYELGHTEWKITLGMAVGLPAVASPQQSYVEAIGYAGGGIVCANAGEWRAAVERLADSAVRDDLGERARRTVVERYSIPASARAYHELLCAAA